MAAPRAVAPFRRCERRPSLRAHERTVCKCFFGLRVVAADVTTATLGPIVRRLRDEPRNEPTIAQGRRFLLEPPEVFDRGAQAGLVSNDADHVVHDAA